MRRRWPRPSVTPGASGEGATSATRLGLVPRQASTGGKVELLGISKRRNRYLRANPTHGAPAVLPRIPAGETPLGRWLRALAQRAHRNVVVVAPAAELAPVVRAVLRGGRPFDAAAASA